MNIPNICPCKQNICSASSDQFCFSNDFGPDAVLQNHNETRRLHLGFTGTPGQMDVICARGKVAQRHSGNERLRAIIESNVHEYAYAPTKLSKSTIVSSILDAVRDGNPRGGFVKYEGGAWHDVGDLVAREKIGQCLRDLLHMKYRSSTKAKVLRKRSTTLSAERQDDSSIPTSFGSTMIELEPEAGKHLLPEGKSSIETFESLLANRKQGSQTEITSLHAIHQEGFGYFYPVDRVRDESVTLATIVSQHQAKWKEDTVRVSRQQGTAPRRPANLSYEDANDLSKARC